MYVSVCICMYVCVYVYVCMYVCMYVCINMYTVLPRFTAPLYNTTPAYRHRLIQYNSISVYFCDMLFYRKHSVAWCFLNNQPTWACLVTCIHYILDFGVVKSKLNLLLYITEFLYSCRPIFFLVSYIAVMNFANCLTFGSVINDSISQNGFPVMVLLPPPPVRQPPHVSGVQKWWSPPYTATCRWSSAWLVAFTQRLLCIFCVPNWVNKLI